MLQTQVRYTITADDGTEYPMSPQQCGVMDFVASGGGSAFVEAVAGAGKTTTMVEACALMEGSIAFLAFNKKIADEIKGKIYARGLSSVKAGTFHSFGYNAWRRAHPKARLDDRGKKETILQRVLSEEDFKLGIDGLVTKLISLAKQNVVEPGADRGEWDEIVEHFDLSSELEDEDLMPRVIDLAIEGLGVAVELAHQVIDFDDMIYMPVLTRANFDKKDWVIVDEAQDTNPARRMMAALMLNPAGRAMFVGDRNQAIYGFTGADCDAIDRIIAKFRCTSLPLTVTYRCPKAVVTESQKYVSHIEAHETAPDGIVKNMASTDIDKMVLGPEDAILCRLNKPLVKRAYSFLRRGVPCHVEGRDIGAGLLALTKRWKVSTVDDLFDRLDTYLEREVDKLLSKGKEAQAEAVQDRVETLKIIAEGCSQVQEVREKILTLFQDGDQEMTPTLTLSTVHKAKGREWKKVLVLAREEMPSRFARLPWQQQQETNLIYVAYTRAQEELYLVQGQ